MPAPSNSSTNPTIAASTLQDCSCYLDEGAKVLVAEERCRSLAQYNGVRWISRPQ